MKKVANAEAGDNTKLEAIFQTAIKNLIEEGKIKDLFSLLSQNTLGVPEYQVPAGEEAPADDTQQSTQGQYLALLLEVNQEDLDAAREFVVSEADPLAQGLIKDTLQTDTTKKIEPYTAATKNLTDFITLGREAVSSSTDSQVLKVFYKEADKKEQVTDPAVVKTNLEALGNAGITTTLKDAGFNEHGRKSKRATGFAVGVKLGADYRFGDARLGAEIGVDIPFGKKIKLITLPDGTDDVTVKRRFSVDALLTAGWHVTPQFWFLVKGGVGYNKYSYNTSGLKSIGGPVKAALTEITKAYNASTDGQKTPIDPKPYQPDESIYKSHSTGKFSPIIGVGIRAAITDSLWVDLSYQHMFRTTVATKEKQGAEIKTGSEQIKVGLIVPLN
jgi:opacity protein-like surface antigen